MSLILGIVSATMMTAARRKNAGCVESIPHGLSLTLDFGKMIPIDNVNAVSRKIAIAHFRAAGIPFFRPEPSQNQRTNEKVRDR